MDFPGCAYGKEATHNCRRHGFSPGVRKIPRGRHGNPLQYSCLENPMDRGAWQATVHRAAESDMTEHNYISFRYMSQWFDIFIRYKMITMHTCNFFKWFLCHYMHYALFKSLGTMSYSKGLRLEGINDLWRTRSYSSTLGVPVFMWKEFLLSPNSKLRLQSRPSRYEDFSSC